MAIAPVLYVEDEETDVFLMKFAFKKAGLSRPLQVVVNGQECVDYLAGTGRFADREQYPIPCLVLLDLNLPLRSGFEVLSWIRAQPPFQSLPVLIFSGSDLGLDQQAARHLGANEYLVKPNGLAAMVNLLTSVSHRWLDPLEAGGAS